MTGERNEQARQCNIPACPQGMAVFAGPGGNQDRAKQLAAELQIPLLSEADEEHRLLLKLDGEGLSLTDGKLSMMGDFTSMLSRLKQSNLSHEMLVKAAKIKNSDHPLTVLDATAGMGEDSLLLAAAGFQVILYEYDPVIAALLADALYRASQDPQLAPIVARMELHNGDSISAMRSIRSRENAGNTGDGGNIPPVPDVILLDPMFPARSKSGLIKKKFQLLQQLERPCSNEEDLLAAAIAASPRKIVIKRPAKGPFLAGRKPDYSLDGKAIRYDCIILTPTRPESFLSIPD